MDVKINPGVSQKNRDKLRGLSMDEIRIILADMLDQGLITKDEYDDLYNNREIHENSADWLGEADDRFVTNGNENADGEVIVVSENGDATLQENVLDICEWDEEEPTVNALADVAEPTVVATPTQELAANLESEPEPEPTPAPETPNTDNDEKEPEPTPAPETPNTDNGEKEPWVSDYSGYLNDWSEKNPTRAVEKLEAEKSSLKASFKDGVALNFSSSSNVAVKASEPSSPKASDFDALLEVAKKSNQKIRLSDKMSNKFRYALIEACAKGGVEIVNLSETGKTLYNSFIAEQQGATLRDAEPEVQNPEETVENKTKEKPETTLTSTKVVTGILVAGIGTTGFTGCQNQTKVEEPKEIVTNATDSNSLGENTYQLTAENFNQNTSAEVNTPSCVPPEEWSEDLGINKRDFNIIRKAYGDAFNQAYTNAYMLQDSLGASASQILLAGRNLVAWTTSPNAKGDAKFNSGILKPYGLENLMKAIMCGDTLITENIEIYRSMIKAGNNDRLNLQVSYLAEINERFALLKHDSEGYLIGNACNQMAYIYECGSQKNVHYDMRNCGCNYIPENIEERIQTVIDTPTVQVPEYVDTTKTYVDTVVTPADTTEKVAPAPKKGGKRYIVSFGTHVGNQPTSGMEEQLNNSASSVIEKGSAGALRRVINKVEKDPKTREKYVEEVNDSKVTYGNQAAQDNQGNWDYSQRTNEGR